MMIKNKKVKNTIDKLRWDNLNNSGHMGVVSDFVELEQDEKYVFEFCHIVLYRDQFIIVPDSMLDDLRKDGAVDYSDKIYLVMGE